MSAAPLTLRVDSTASEPLGAAAARGLGSSKATSADSHFGEGTFTAQIALTLYDGTGTIRDLSDAPSSITGATLTGDATAVIQVQGLEGSSSTVTVTVRQDGTYAAVEHINGATITYDSRNGAPSGSVEQGLANLAGTIAGLAGAGGSDTGLASAAPTALSSLVAPGGTTTVDGDDLDGTTFTVQRTADGVETASVTSTGGGYDADAVSPAAFDATDAFGDTVSVKGGAQGAIAISLTDELGNTFGFNDGADGAQASLTAAVTVGGYSQTAKAEIVAQDEVTLTTGSIARDCDGGGRDVRKRRRDGERRAPGRRRVDHGNRPDHAVAAHDRIGGRRDQSDCCRHARRARRCAGLGRQRG